MAIDFDKFPEPPLFKPSSTFCSFEIHKFLKTSRALTDDVVKQRLNSISCNDFIKVLVKNWSERSKALQYCQKQVVETSLYEINKANADARLDPYSVKEYQIDNQLKQYLQNQLEIENILKQTSLSVLKEHEDCDLSLIFK